MFLINNVPAPIIGKPFKPTDNLSFQQAEEEKIGVVAKPSGKKKFFRNRKNVVRSRNDIDSDDDMPANGEKKSALSSLLKSH